MGTKIKLDKTNTLHITEVETGEIGFDIQGPNLSKAFMLSQEQTIEVINAFVDKYLKAVRLPSRRCPIYGS